MPYRISMYDSWNGDGAHDMGVRFGRLSDAQAYAQDQLNEHLSYNLQPPAPIKWDDTPLGVATYKVGAIKVKVMFWVQQA